LLCFIWSTVPFKSLPAWRKSLPIINHTPKSHFQGEFQVLLQLGPTRLILISNKWSNGQTLDLTSGYGGGFSSNFAVILIRPAFLIHLLCSIEHIFIKLKANKTIFILHFVSLRRWKSERLNRQIFKQDMLFQSENLSEKSNMIRQTPQIIKCSSNP